MNEHADAVRHERLRRNWSVRKASAAGNISNTYWGEFEDYKRTLTPHIAAAVARAFEWPDDWAEDSFAVEQLANGESVATKLDVVEREVRRLARGLDQLADVVGVTLTDADALPPSTDVDPPDAGERPSSP